MPFDKGHSTKDEAGEELCDRQFQSTARYNIGWRFHVAEYVARRELELLVAWHIELVLPHSASNLHGRCSQPAMALNRGGYEQRLDTHVVHGTERTEPAQEWGWLPVGAVNKSRSCGDYGNVACWSCLNSSLWMNLPPTDSSNMYKTYSCQKKNPHSPRICTKSKNACRSTSKM